MVKCPDCGKKIKDYVDRGDHYRGYCEKCKAGKIIPKRKMFESAKKRVKNVREKVKSFEPSPLHSAVAFFASFLIITLTFIWKSKPILDFISFLLSLTPYTIGLKWAPYALITLFAFFVAAILFKRGIWTSIFGSAGIVIGVFILVGLVNSPIFAGSSINDILENLGTSNIACYLQYWNSPMMMATCSQEEEDVPQFIGQKEYRLLRINLGDDPFGDKTYVIPRAYANYDYELPFYMENLDKREEDEEGTILEDISIRYVYAYKNEKLSEQDRPFIRFQNTDVCSKTLSNEGCIIPPEERKKVLASGFEEFTIVDGERFEFTNIIPCEVRDLYSLTFEMGVEYDLNATHDRTFLLVRSEKDKKIINEDPELKNSLKAFAPSDGPLDLIIDFGQNPYTLGERLPEDRIRLSAYIINTEMNGIYSPEDEMLTLNTVGKLPAWIDGSDGGCTLDNIGENGVIRFTVSPEDSPFIYTVGSFTEQEIVEYKCTLMIDKDSYPQTSPYQKITFSGKFGYTYRQKQEFPRNKYSRVDKSDCEYIVEDGVQQPSSCIEEGVPQDTSCKAVDTDSLEDGDGDKPLVRGVCTPYVCKESIDECVPSIELRDTCVDGVLTEYINSSNECVPKDYICNEYCVGGVCSSNLRACECPEELE